MQLDQKVNAANTWLRDLVLAASEDVLFAVLFMLLWLWVFLTLTRGFRAAADGSQRDGSVLIMALVVALSIAATGLSMTVYLAFKFYIFGSFGHSILFLN